MFFAILLLAFLLGAGVYLLGSRDSRDKWELVRTVSSGKMGLYKRRKYIKFGKYERVFSTYIVARAAPTKRAWSFVWKMDRIVQGGRAIGAHVDIDVAGQPNLHEVGFSAPLGVYVTYTGEEDHLRYLEREQYLLDVYKQTVTQHKHWREDPSFKVRQHLARWRNAIATFAVVAAIGGVFVPSDVEAPQVLVWTLIGTMALGLLTSVLCAVKTQGHALWVQASGGVLLATCILSAVTLPPLMLGTNNASFATLCKGSVPVERSWTVGTGNSVSHFADVTLPQECAFDAHTTLISPALYHEFQAGRKVIDVVVSQGLLGYKRIRLIGT